MTFRIKQRPEWLGSIRGEVAIQIYTGWMETVIRAGLYNRPGRTVLQFQLLA